MTHDEMIAVIQAHKEDKRLQATAKKGNKSSWIEATSPCWDFDDYVYRIKPAEPIKTKLTAWFNPKMGTLSYRDQPLVAAWIRVPSEDKIITLPAKD